MNARSLRKFSKLARVRKAAGGLVPTFREVPAVCCRCDGAKVFNDPRYQQYIQGRCFRCGGSGIDPRAKEVELASEASQAFLAACEAEQLKIDEKEAIARAEQQARVAREIRERLEADERRKAEREAARLAHLATLPKLEAGRRELRGKVLSAKQQHSQFGVTNKLLIELDDGNKVFGSWPSHFAAVKHDDDYHEEDGVRTGYTIRGLPIAIVATVEPKDEHFGFFSRPKVITTKSESKEN